LLGRALQVIPDNPVNFPKSPSELLHVLNKKMLKGKSTSEIGHSPPSLLFSIIKINGT